jgi:RNA-directed DNA polymerase
MTCRGRRPQRDIRRFASELGRAASPALPDKPRRQGRHTEMRQSDRLIVEAQPVQCPVSSESSGHSKGPAVNRIERWKWRPYTEMEHLTHTKLALISRRSRQDSKFRFMSLAHLSNTEFLRECCMSLGREKACGIDGTSWQEYGKHLDDNLADLVMRLKAKRYKPLPAKRVYIPKNEKEYRPLGLPSIEDKIVQKGIAVILEAIYEADFMDFSYGFRPNRSCHQALKAVNDTIMSERINYVIEADIKGFFDNVSHDRMMKFLEVRICDSSLLLLIRIFLKAGYMESGKLIRSEEGTPRGGNLSPILANIFLHYVLDLYKPLASN